ncbi:MAG TPA: hypothetical protein VFS71_07950 [Flavobacterium sp.]|uniref:hypothetical protein n=1 Tax=Flavobacterium sp. TaxID=239 RepID=UPI002DB5859A|nr:hypothetical protein [Flavobacterium sp.]HEU4789599.1 hypothetical protein [Flavobacterium sp.]
MKSVIKYKGLKRFIFIGILCCSIVTIYFFCFSSRVQIEVYNKTDFDIDSLNIDDKFYKIPKQKSLVINCRKLTIQNNLPFGSPKGILKNMPRDTMPEFLCGTGVEEIRSGKYKFDIKAFIGTDYYMLDWAEHK